MTSKLHVKLGRLELDFEGSEDFIKQELMTVLGKLKEFGALHDMNDDDAIETKNGGKPKLGGDLTTSTIAGKLGVDSGTELAIAAMVRLTVMQSADKATRTQITTEMRTATAYFKESYISNLTKSLKVLVTSQRLNDLGSSTYSLSASEKTKLEAKLAAAK